MKTSKKIFVAIIIISLCSICYKGFFYIKNEKYYNRLVKLHILKKCFNPSMDFLEIFNQENLDYGKLNEQAIETSLEYLNEIENSASTTNKIPYITHKVYFTGNNLDIPSFYLQAMKMNYEKLNAFGNWEHNFWTNKQTNIPEEFKNIKSLKIHYIEELENEPQYKILLNLVEEGKEKKLFLAQAADLIRIMLVHKFGGIYSDADYEIYNVSELIKLMQNFDFIAGREHSGINCYYGNSFFAAKPNHPIMEDVMSLSERNYSLSSKKPKYLEYVCDNYDLLYFNGPPLITFAYLRKNNLAGNRDIILPSWMLYNVSFIRYKYQEDFSTKITEDKFFQKNSLQDKLLANFIANPKPIESHKEDLLKVDSKPDNIFYHWDNAENYPIIGADMFSGSWNAGGKLFGKNHYWNFIWK